MRINLLRESETPYLRPASVRSLTMRKNSRHGETTEATEPGVDLGLQALIDGDTIPELPTRNPSMDEEINREEVEEEFEEEVEVGSTKHLLWLKVQGDWNEISILCEERIALIGPTDVEARAWWVLSQRELGLPFSLLVAPLESLSGDILHAEVQEDTKQIVVALITAAVPLLVERGEQCLAELLTGRAKQLQPDFQEIPSAPAIPPPAPPVDSPQHHRRHAGYALASILGVSALLSGIAMTKGGVIQGVPDTKFHPVYYQAPSPQIRNPELLPVVEMSHLDAVLYDLDRPASVKAAPAVSREVLPKEEPTATSVKRVKKEAINTTGPVEPVGFLQNVEEPPPTKLEESSPFERGGSPISIRADQGEAKTALQRSARFYTIVVRTEVFSGPTRTSPTIAELQQGDHIEVDAEVGEWLKIRSRRGSPGFVLARDAMVETKSRDQYAVRR